MTRTRTNVVPFERPAAYWAEQARKRYTPDQLPSAARLLRKALEKSGDASLAQELAQVYALMGCYSAAERCLLRVSQHSGLSGSLCYAVGVCALNRGLEELGERALDQSLRLDPAGPFAEEAQDLLEGYPWKPTWFEARSARGQELLRQSQKCLREGRLERAVSLAWRAWERGRLPQAALWLGKLLPPGEGLRYLRYAAEELPLELEAQLRYILACYACRRYPQVRERLESARRLCHSLTDAEAYCAAAWQANRPRDALKLVEKRLREYPMSVDYLYLKYLSLRRLGQEEAAKRTLEALLEIDPGDQDALFDRAHPENLAWNRDRALPLEAVGGMLASQARPQASGNLNRLLHFVSVALNGYVPADMVYREVLPAWRRLGRAEKEVCGRIEGVSYPAAFSLYVLYRANLWSQAAERMKTVRHQKRVRRLLGRLIRGGGI